jgi:hypothetical protein
MSLEFGVWSLELEVVGGWIMVGYDCEVSPGGLRLMDGWLGYPLKRWGWFCE